MNTIKLKSVEEVLRYERVNSWYGIHARRVGYELTVATTRVGKGARARVCFVYIATSTSTSSSIITLLSIITLTKQEHTK
jgi:hypothetical protein